MNPKKLAVLFLLILAIVACNGITPPPENGPEYVTVWICPESGALSGPYCPVAEQRTYLKGEQPTETCAIHQELFDFEVCIDSGKLKHTWCPEDRIEIRKYPAGEEPQSRCDFHKEPIPQLDMELRVPEINKKLGYPIYMGAFFAKDLGISHSDFTWEEVKKFIDKIARENLSNVIRMFGFLAYPSCNYPHPEKANGKYDLNTINPVWYAQLHKTIAYCVERGIMVRLVMFDEHSYNRRWAYHWTNWRNNDGFGKADGKLYPLWEDKYLHTKWSNYCLRDANGRCDADCRAKYCTSMEYLFWFYRQTIQPLNEEFGDMIAFESNEINAGSFWHEDIGKLLHDEFGIPRWRMITSQVGGADWINTKPMIKKYWIPELHGIIDEAHYDEAQAAITTEWIWSWDGHGGRAFVDRWDELQRIYSKSLRDKGRGCGGNNWLLNSDLSFDHLDYRSGEVIRDETRKFLRTQ